jgi:hypothetical protein
MGFFYDDPSEHPDALELDIAGKTVPWLLSKKAFEEAEEKEGVDFVSLEEIDEGDLVGNLEALAQVVWAGTLPFEDAETPTLEELERAITPKTASRIGPDVLAQYEGIVDEQVEQAVGKE